MTAIEATGLTKYYGSLCAVDDLNLNIDNEVFGLLGPNGSGKTTTVLMLTTLLRQTKGEASICGYDVAKEGERVREKISYVPQDLAVDRKLTGRENVMFFAKLYGVKNREEQVSEVLEVMDLLERADDRVSTYSGGMRRRLELAQALVHEPEVLFLDEPTIGLDVAARKTIWEHITALKKNGMTIFVTTHYMDEADQSCDRVGIINKGKIEAVDSPYRLKSSLMRDIITATITGDYSDPEIDGVRILGHRINDQITFMADNGSEMLPLLAHALREQGIKVRSLSLREPTLDDVFLHLVGREEDRDSFNFNSFRNVIRSKQ